MADQTMGDLEVVGLDESGGAVVVRHPTRPGELLRLPLGDQLRAAVRGDLGAVGQLRLGLGSPPSPREIQARLRAGESSEEIADASGVAVERIARWEGPVIAEREHVLEAALSCRLPDRDTPLGEAVAAQVRAAGHDPDRVAWTAIRSDDRQWVVTATRDERSGSWSWVPAARRLTPLDGGARTLLDDPPPAAVPLRPSAVVDPPVADPDGEALAPRVSVPSWDDILAETRPGGGLRFLDEIGRHDRREDDSGR